MNQNPTERLPVHDFLRIKMDDDISASFDRIAEKLFNEYLIEVNSHCYRILEMEFYYKSDKHPDVYTHGHPLQTKTGHWYFHGSGVDLTFGEKNSFGGILIRGVEKITPQPATKKEQYFFGPLTAQIELLNHLHPVFSSEANTFRLIAADSSIPKVLLDDIIQCRRIGLSDKKEYGDAFHKKHYRYLIYPHLGHKEKTNIAEALREKYKADPQHLNRIKKMLGSEFLKEHR